MTDRITIPPEAIEAAAEELFHIQYGEYHGSWADAPEWLKVTVREEARAALSPAQVSASYTTTVDSPWNTQPAPWPKGFYKVERSIMDRCASDGCGQIPSIRVEVGGVGGIHCEPCAREIAKHLPLPPPPEKGCE